MLTSGRWNVPDWGSLLDTDLDQAGADALIALSKISDDDKTIEFPGIGQQTKINLVSSNRREKFFLDIRRNRIAILSCKHQLRGRQVVVLARVDIGGTPHQNPDDECITGPHLHVYKHGYGVRWAIPLPEDVFSNPDNLKTVFDDFMRYCNIIEPPRVQWSIE